MGMASYNLILVYFFPITNCTEPKYPVNQFLALLPIYSLQRMSLKSCEYDI